MKSEVPQKKSTQSPKRRRAAIPDPPCGPLDYEPAVFSTKKPDHAEFTVSSLGYKMELVDDAGVTVVVTWQSTRRSRYKVTIERDAGHAQQKPYSLFNLNVQARNWPVWVTHDTTDGVKVELLRSTDDPAKFEVVPPTNVRAGEQWEVPATNAAQRIKNKDYPNDANDFRSLHYLRVVDDAVWFVKFSGRVCSLTIRAERKTLGTPMPMQGLSGKSGARPKDSHGGFGDGGYSGGE